MPIREKQMAAPSPGTQPSPAPVAPTLAPQTSLASSSSQSAWTREQDKQFENALSIYDQDASSRWENVAAMVPGKDAVEVKRHYEVLQEDIGSIDAGRVAMPNYSLSSLSTSEEVGVSDSLGTKKGALYPGQASGSGTNVNGSNGSSALGKGVSSKSADQERRKGIPWTEEEHRWDNLRYLGVRSYILRSSHNFTLSRYK